MRRNAIAAVVLTTFSAGLLIAAEQSGQRDWTSRDEAALAPPTPALLAIWTDKLGYLRRHDLVSVYLAMDPMRERRRFHELIYMEHIETGKRQYLVREGAFPRLRDEIVDVRGNSPSHLGGERLRHLPTTKIWGGRVLEPGLWQFVVELRDLNTSEIVKRAHAKFVVSPRIPVMIGSDGRDTEISTDTTWTNDKIYAIRHQVFVNAGATLTIEPGTLILARGPNASIVVERDGTIMAQGRPDAPIVMSCDAPLGQRFEGCWGGLVVLGNAPTTRGTTVAAGAVPETRSLYGGDDPTDSSGVLQYLRVEFAGADARSGTAGAGLGFHGVGSGTLIDHVQARASAGDGILFSGGTADCMYCVSSGARDDELAWAHGWQGRAQHVFLQQGPDGGDCGIEGENDELGFDALPRSAPKLYNVTLVGPSMHGPRNGSHGGGIMLRAGSAVTARNVLVLGFASGAIDVRDGARSLFIDGTSSIDNAIFSTVAGGTADGQVNGGLESMVDYLDEEPMLVNVRYQVGPDPRPMLGSPALAVGAGAVPPSDGMLDTSAQYIGAFGDSNWLEEWTVFGPETDYAMREAESADDQP
ncbi:MAG: hypothetical protein F4Y02_13155 [Chloroflexi bacterium]|nr:hypothetical protein [Chloroflexota bacterium]